MTKVKKSSILLTCLLLALLCGLLFYIDGNASKYIIRITRLCAINIVLALSMNLVNGFTASSPSATRASWPSAHIPSRC